MNEAAARALLVETGHRLLAEGLVARRWGNLSIRLDEHTMAITPSGIAYPDLTEKMIVLVGLETDTWSGPYRPSGERELHRAVYRGRPDVFAGVHTHQVAASICAAARVAVPTPSLGEVPCAPYAFPGTRKLSGATVGALGAGPAVLMANHGVFTVGADLESAFGRVTALERACADHVVVKRPYEGSHMPADPDAPWDPSCLSEVTLADGSPGWLSEAPFTVRFSVLRKALPPVLDDLAQLTGRHVAPVRSTPRRRPRRDAVLISGRGALVFGSDHEAVAMVVEKAARAWIGGAGVGGAKPLPAWEALLMRIVYARSYSTQAAEAHPAA